MFERTNRIESGLPAVAVIGAISGMGIASPQSAYAETQPVPKALIANSVRIARQYWSHTAPKERFNDYIASGCYRDLTITEATDQSELIGGEAYAGEAHALAFIGVPNSSKDHCKIRISPRVYEYGEAYTCSVVSHEIGHFVLKDYFDGHTHSKDPYNLMYGPIAGSVFYSRTAEMMTASAPYCAQPISPSKESQKLTDILQFAALEATGNTIEACRTIPKKSNTYYCKDSDYFVLKVNVRNRSNPVGEAPNVRASIVNSDTRWDKNRVKGGKLIK